jgi:hypothetical protein
VLAHVPWCCALTAAVLGALTVGSLLLPPRGAPADSRVWPFAGIPDWATLQAGISPVRPGDVASIEFTLGAFRGSDIFLPGGPASVEIGCTSRTAARTRAALGEAAHGTLLYDADRYTYTFRWLTAASWAGTCRRLTLNLADGSAHEVLVWFGDPFGPVTQAPPHG